MSSIALVRTMELVSAGAAMQELVIRSNSLPNNLDSVSWRAVCDFVNNDMPKVMACIIFNADLRGACTVMCGWILCRRKLYILLKWYHITEV